MQHKENVNNSKEVQFVLYNWRSAENMCLDRITMYYMNRFEIDQIENYSRSNATNPISNRKYHIRIHHNFIWLVI